MRGCFLRALPKRIMDLVGAGVLLLALAPLIALVAGLVAVLDGRPVLYWDERVGRGRKRFRMPKFRTMVPGPPSQKRRGDPRVTALGRVLRRYSIDELPQLWSVLRGEMSLVGPRPLMPQDLAGVRAGDGARWEALPGLTCTWQVSGRSDLPFRTRMDMDAAYVRQQCLALDLRLLLKTLPAVLSGRGAW